jgi:hypothetical protein
MARRPERLAGCLPINARELQVVAAARHGHSVNNSYDMVALVKSTTDVCALEIRNEYRLARLLHDAVQRLNR